MTKAPSFLGFLILVSSVYTYAGWIAAAITAAIYLVGCWWIYG